MDSRTGARHLRLEGKAFGMSCSAASCSSSNSRDIGVGRSPKDFSLDIVNKQSSLKGRFELVISYSREQNPMVLIKEK